MGIFSTPTTVATSAPPPPPPVPPAAPPATAASGQIQATAQNARQRAAAASGSGFSGTELTSPQGTGAANTAKAELLGGTS